MTAIASLFSSSLSRVFRRQLKRMPRIESYLLRRPDGSLERRYRLVPPGAPQF